MRGAYTCIITAALALLCVSAMGESPSPDMSGIEGTITVSPTHGGPIRQGEESSVAPVRNTVFVVQAGATTVKSFTTDADGRFRVALPPGHYVIAREGAPPRIGGWRFEADVAPGRMTTVTWTADSGMR